MKVILDGTRWVMCKPLEPEVLGQIKLESDRMQYRTYTVDLRGIDSSLGLMERLACSLRFPDYFGKNWDALLDMLSDLRWDEELQPGYVILLEHADSLLDMAEEEVIKFVLVCSYALERWQDGLEEGGVIVPLTPFYVIFDGGQGICKLIERVRKGEKNRL